MMADFLLPGLSAKHMAIIVPAIDSLATKNMELPEDLCRRAIADSGVDPTRPLLAQVSRFDPWKDPLGVMRAYRLIKEEIPAVQLVLIGAMAGDDPKDEKSWIAWKSKPQTTRISLSSQTWPVSAVWRPTYSNVGLML